MSIYECQGCQRRYVAQTTPKMCRWCDGLVFSLKGSEEPPFDVLVYMKHVRAHPEAYGNLALLAMAVKDRKEKGKTT